MRLLENRYEIVKIFICLSLIFLFTSTVQAQDELNVIRGESSNNSWLQYSDASNALYHHLSGQAYDMLDKRKKEISEINSLSAWQQRQGEVRKILADIIEPFPEKTPLNAEVLRTVEKEDYIVEHIVYESQPRFYVTSSLFIPKEVKSPRPAILFTSGHSNRAYRRAIYQVPIINLVKKGFIVFAIDPVGQGERLQYYDPDSGRSIVGSATREHSYAGAQAFITGSSLARYMIWDGIRAVDYLLNRPEVDPERIGIHGLSGGGTQAAYIAAFDERIAASAPAGYITNFKRLLQSIGPQDAEQNFYHGIVAGLDHADLLEVRAPRPTLMVTTTEDFFSIQGARETAREVSKIYEAYGEPGNFEMVEDSGGHGYTRQNREAMYAFFQKHLDNPGDPGEEEVDVLSEEEIRVTDTGQVSTAREAETVFSLNHRRAQRQLRDLRSSRADLDSHLPQVLASARKLSGYREPKEVHEPVFTGRIQRDGYVIEKYFARGEGNYPIPYLLLKPDHPTGKAILYIHPDGKAAEAAQGGEMEWLARNGYMVLAPDMIGTGEMGPGELANYATQVKDFNAASFDVWIASVLIGRSITGIRAGDAVRLTRLLEQQAGTEQVYGIARKEMSPVLLHAAAFEPAIRRVALLEPYASYRSIVMNRFYNPGFHISTVAGSLEAYDLPDLAASLSPRKLLMAGVTNAAGEITNGESITGDMEVIRDAYKQNKTAEEVTITTYFPNNLDKLLTDWLK